MSCERERQPIIRVIEGYQPKGEAGVDPKKLKPPRGDTAIQPLPACTTWPPPWLKDTPPKPPPPAADPSCVDMAIHWFAALGKAVDAGDYETAALAVRELHRLGVDMVYRPNRCTCQRDKQ